MNENRIPDIMFFGTLFICVSCLSTLSYFPYVDTFNHLARWNMLANYWFSGVKIPAVVSFIPTPYIMLDFVAAFLIHLFSPAVALKIIVFATLLSITIGSYLLIKKVNYNNRGWAIVSILFFYNKFTTPDFLQIISDSDEILFRSVYDKIEHLLSPFYGYSIYSFILFVSIYFVSAALYLYGFLKNKNSMFNRIYLVVLVLVVIYLICPVQLIDAYDVDVRFLLPMFLLVFAAPSIHEIKNKKIPIVTSILVLIYKIRNSH